MAAELLTLARAATHDALGEITRAPSEAAPAPADLLTPLARYGDALRVSVPIPDDVRRWTGTLSPDTLEAVAMALVEEAATWPLSMTAWDDDPSLAFVVRRRDEAESVRQAVVSIVVRRSPHALACVDSVDAALAATDLRLAEHLDRAAIERLLGERAGFDPTWADDFAGAAASTLERETAQADSPEAALDYALGMRPSPQAIQAYLFQGALVRTIEGVAARDREFADDLADEIRATLDDGESLAPAARAWFETRQGAPAARQDVATPASNVIHVAFGRPLKFRAPSTYGIQAAADDAMPQWDDAASGELVHESDDLTIHVHERKLGAQSEVAIRLEAKRNRGLRLDAPDAVVVVDENAVERSAPNLDERGPLYRLLSYSGEGTFTVRVRALGLEVSFQVMRGEG
jgi:hypothetical protein